MKYGEFKTHLKGIMIGDKNVPDDTVLRPIVFQVLKQVALKVEPLVLITNDVEYEILKTLENELFMRVPYLPQSDEEELDIDETLVYAVVYLVATKISSKDNIIKYEREAWDILNEYMWKRFRDIESGLFDYDKTLIENALNINGYKKIYTKKINTTEGYKYEWDTKFITTLALYLSGENPTLSKSDRTNIDAYFAYQIDKVGDAQMYDAFDEYLKGL
jgi:hypothetical protein